MNKELDKKLCEKYPLLFKNRYGDMKETLMCWGFECGDGWYPLLNALCRKLMWDGRDHEHKWVRQDPPVVVQVKEKFGGLRFYVDSSTDIDDAIIEFAELLSYSICENCGSMKDVSQTKGWIKTRCLSCHQEAGDIEYGN